VSPIFRRLWGGWTGSQRDRFSVRRPAAVATSEDIQKYPDIWEAELEAERTGNSRFVPEAQFITQSQDSQVVNLVGDGVTMERGTRLAPCGWLCAERPC
jgi:hypothetical protein